MTLCIAFFSATKGNPINVKLTITISTLFLCISQVIYINNRLAGPRTSAKETRGQCDIRQFCNFKKKCNRKARK